MEKLDVLAFGAHPDDVELMCAATLVKLKNRGYKTGAVSLTAAELGTRGTPQIRKKENQKAAEILGLSAHVTLDIPDGSVRVSEENKLKVIEQIRRFRPSIVFAPYWKTRHPDHGHCSTLVKEASFFSGLKNIKTDFGPFRPAKVIYYMELYDFKPSFIVDVSDSFEEKIKSIKAYKSQFFSDNNDYNKEGATYISTPEFLQSIITKGQYWGHKIGAKFGEPFLVREPMVLDDPVKQFSNINFAGLL
jgi:N-acetylglucosamine malate deacetylase 1